MSVLFYNFLHLAAVIGVFTALGILATSDCKGCLKKAVILHGIGLVLILVSGFGMIAKMDYGFPLWVILKLVIWLALGAMLVVAKRKLLPRPAVMALILGLGFFAAWLGLYGKIMLAGAGS